MSASSVIRRFGQSEVGRICRQAAILAMFMGLCLAAAAAPGEAITNAAPEAAHPLPLSAVRLTGGPLKRAQDLDAEYLLKLEPDRMMAGYRIQAGLVPKAPSYGGWDRAESRQLTGHIAGHYLSAVSYMFAATGDVRFKERADYLVNELREVQDVRGSGYLGAIQDSQGRDGEAIFQDISRGDIRSGGFDMNGLWSPWYTLHKTYAGLRDAFRLTGNYQALDVEVRFAEWAEKVIAPLTDRQVQQMLNTEYGGMNEIMADLYADTGDRRWLDLSYKFEHKRFVDPLKRHRDNVSGAHGNTSIPKLIGSASRYVYAGDPFDLMAASFFWDTVVRHHTYASGGNSQVENFPATDQLASSIDNAGSQRTSESCNVYNMLKLTRRLFSIRPDAEYADYQERALFNHVLASIDPTEGWMSYMVPVGQGVRQEYERNMLDGGFTCCTGSGMESHALHADGIYYEMDGKLWVNIYAPSTADWAAQRAKLTMETDFPVGESAKLTMQLFTPKELTLALRKPYWAGDKFEVKINGEVWKEPVVDTWRGRGGRGGGQGQGPGQRGGQGQGQGQRQGQGQGQARGQGGGGNRGRGRGGSQAPPISSYVELTRTWKTGDTVELKMPKSLRTEPTPDAPTRVAFMYGPLVLAGDMGPIRERGGGGRGQRGQNAEGGQDGQGGQRGQGNANEQGNQAAGSNQPSQENQASQQNQNEQGSQGAQGERRGQGDRRGGQRGQRGRRGGGGGRGGRGQAAPIVPVFTAADRPLQDWLKPVEGESLTFRTEGVGHLPSTPQAVSDITFRPFYQTHRRTYGVYWDVVSPAGFDLAIEKFKADEARRQIEAMTLGFALPGQMQSERDFNYQSSIEERNVEDFEGRNGRKGVGWFSFDMPVEAGRPAILRATYHSDSLPNSTFAILVDGKRIGEQPAAGNANGFHDVDYQIPAEVTQEKEFVTVRFEAGEGSEIATVFGLRMVRPNSEQPAAADRGNRGDN